MADTELLTVRFEMRASEPWMDALDQWRSQRKPIPSRAEAIRQLVAIALAAEASPATPSE